MLSSLIEVKETKQNSSKMYVMSKPTDTRNET